MKENSNSGYRDIWFSKYKGGLIVEIGIVGLNLETGNITNEFESIVKENGFSEKDTLNILLVRVFQKFKLKLQGCFIGK